MDYIRKHIREQNKLTAKIADDKQFLENIGQVIKIITGAYKSGNKVMFCGNGGSAADAQHLAAELSGKFCIDREPLAAEALHVNSSYITAVANDYSFDKIYSRYVAGAGRKGDILIGLSTSGDSENIIQAFAAARKNQMITIGFTGQTGGRLRELSDFLINIPSKNVPRIQEMHLLTGHIICEEVEKKLFGDETQQEKQKEFS
ncbi:MAG: D-sedoheptulose-7-phosphate isomerase [Tangfeifania sp.]